MTSPLNNQARRRGTRGGDEKRVQIARATRNITLRANGGCANARGAAAVAAARATYHDVATQRGPQPSSGLNDDAVDCRRHRAIGRFASSTRS
jgi:hypothetical protein